MSLEGSIIPDYGSAKKALKKCKTHIKKQR